MKTRIPLLVILVGLLIACSNDDNAIQQDTTPANPINFAAIGEDANTVYQFVYDATAANGVTTNLTQNFNVPVNYLTQRQFGDVVSFFSFSQGAFTLRLVDVFSGANSTFSNFYSNVPERGIAWGTNDFDSVYFGYFTSNDRDLGILDLNLITGEARDLILDNAVSFVFDPIFSGDKIYIGYRDLQENYKLTFYNVSTNTSGSILNLGATPISYLLTEDNQLAVLLSDGSARIQFYDGDTLNLLSDENFGLQAGFNVGPISGAVIKDRQFFYAFPNVQPAEFSFSPAVFNLDTQENEVYEIRLFANTIEQDLGTRPTFITQQFDALNNVFLVSYGLDTADTAGGVLQIGTDGTEIANIATTFFPTYFLEN